VHTNWQTKLKLLIETRRLSF